MIRPIVVLSHCLADRACRYNGQALRDPIVARMASHVMFRPVCPEMEIGLGVPREPIRLIQKENVVALVQPATGRDVTREMRIWTDEFLGSLEAVDGFLLKGRSPTCGPCGVRVYSSRDQGAPIRTSVGIFAAAVRERFPLVAMEDEGRLMNYALRRHFFTRLFTSARFRRVRSMADLARFQATHKLLLLGYQEKGLRELGTIVANHDRLDFSEVLRRYRLRLARMMTSAPRVPATLNVLEHAFGYVSRSLSPPERLYFLDLLKKYRDARVPFSVPATVIRSWVARFNVPYLADQVLFEPYPEELEQISDSGKGRDL